MWAVTARARLAPLSAQIVLCLHDELLLHVPEETAGEAATLLSTCLAEAARRWSPRRTPQVRFISETTVIKAWSEAKP
jgi:DNA polymerase-1